MIVLGVVALDEWTAELLADDHDEECAMTDAELNQYLRPMIYFTRGRGGGTFFCPIETSDEARA